MYFCGFVQSTNPNTNTMGKHFFNTFIIISLSLILSLSSLFAQECLPPEYDDVYSITGTTATISWEDYNGYSSWDFALSPVELEDPSTATILRTITGEEFITYEATNLTPETTYYYYIRTNCGGNSHSEWIDGTFRTRCADNNVPYNINFNTYEANETSFPDCWTKIQGTSFITYVDAEHMNALQVRGYTTVSLPSFALPISTLRIQFSIRTDDVSSSFELGVVRDLEDWSTYTAIETIQLPSPYTFYDRAVNFSNYTGQGKYIILRNSSNYAQYIDNIVVSLIPDCMSPENLQVSNITSNSAVIAWDEVGTATQWNTLLSTSPITNFNNQNPNTVNNPSYSANSLNPNTTYYFYVRSRCSGDFSDWVSTSFTTRCSSSALPTSESFTINQVPTCWERERVVGNADVNFVGFGNPPVCNPASGTAMVMWASSTNGTGWQARLKSMPLRTTGSSALDVNFKWNHDISNENGLGDGVQIQYSTDGITWANSTQGMIHRYDGIHNGWTEYDVIVPEAGNLSTVYIGFLFNTGGSGSNCYMDEVTFRAATGCYTPVNVAVTNINGNSATITWNEVGTASSWDLIISETPVTNFSNANIINVTSTTYTANGLNSATDYYVYVRSKCSSSSYSSWTTETSFTSGCGVILTFPHTESFDNYGTCTNAFPPCWVRHGQPDLGTYYHDGQTCYTPSATDINAIDGDKSLMVCTPSGCFTYTITPPLQENIRNLAVTFFLLKSTNDCGTFEVGVMSNPNDAATFESITTVNPSTVGEWELFAVNFTNANLSGTGNRIAFRHNGMTDDNYYLVDGLTIMEAPDCFPAYLLTVEEITGNSATISWENPNGPSAQWRVKISDTPLNDLSQTANVYDQTIPNTSLTINYLHGGTTYHYYIQSVCSGSSIGEWTHGTFTTPPCNCYVDICMNGSYATGWSGAKIRMKIGSTVIAEVTMESGIGQDTVRVYTCESQSIDYFFISGSNNSDISFTIVNNYGNTLYTTPGTPTVGQFLSATPDCGVSCDAIPANLTATSVSNGVQLAWGATPEALSYTVYRDDVMIANYITTTSYLDASAGIGTFCYNVTANCIAGESNKSNSACATDIEEHNLSRTLRIYPNPANDRFTISAEFPFTLVSVVNLLGQEVISKDVAGNQTEINVAELPNGIYLVKILESNSWIVRKIIVE